MKWFNNLKISKKLIIGFVMVALLAGLVGLIGVWNMIELDNAYAKLFVNHGVSQGDLGQASTAYQRIRVILREVIIMKDPAEKARLAKMSKELDKTVEENLAKVEKTMETEEGKKVLAKLRADRVKFAPYQEQLIALALSGQEAQAMTILRSDAYQVAADINESMDKLIDLKAQAGETQSAALGTKTNRSIMIMIGIVITAMILALGLGLYIARMISIPLGGMVEAAKKIADGDLNVEIEATTKDEIGALAAAFRRMSDNINEVLTNISASSEQVAAGAKQLSESSMALSQGATEQASSIEELTASIEEISTQTRQNAQNANHANQLAEAAKGNAAEGNSQMREMLTAMEEINLSSANISKIIKVIDEIAFQTNILALNAAVEAARAGQHGKGFAVVAEEVRNLAARSANAAKETTVMIEGSIKKVEGGTKIANETAKALSEIVSGVSKMADLVSQIASASDEQAAGVEQVNQGVNQVSQVVQTNSATAEESAAASEELTGQADLLREMVSRFKLKRMATAQYNEISPDVLRVIEAMGDKKRAQISFSEGKREIAATRTKIALSDAEFGKY